jgi:hypothetical protein
MPRGRSYLGWGPRPIAQGYGTTPEHGVWPRWCRGHRGRHRSYGTRGDVEEKCRAFTPTEAWCLGSMANQSYCQRYHHHSPLPVEHPPSAMAVVWDGRESAMRHREAKLSTCCSRVTWRSHFTLFSHSLVFGSGMSEMSSRQQAAAAMLFAVWGKQRPLGAPCGHCHRCREGAWSAAVQSLTFGA